MSSALSPREIQERIKAGASVDEVAAAAGLPVEQLSGFIGPALAERAYIAQQAQSGPVRGSGTTTGRTLGEVISNRLPGIEVTWDAIFIERGLWKVSISYRLSDEDRVAEFDFHQRGRFSTPANSAARWLQGELGASTVIPAATPEVEDEPTVTLSPAIPSMGEFNEDEDAFSEADLVEVDGVYDLTPPTSNTDALYDIIASINEDSVKIYTGLLAEAKSGYPKTDTEPEPKPASSKTPSPKTPPAGDPVTEEPIVEQPTLLEAPARPPRRKRRASVPGWDAILFGNNTD